MLQTAPIVPAAPPTTSTTNAIRQQLVAAGASEQFIKLVTGEYENLSLPVAIPDFGAGKFKTAPAGNAASGNTPAGLQGGNTSTTNSNLPHQGANRAAAGTVPNNNQGGATNNQAGAGAGTPPHGAAGDKKTASANWLTSFRNKVAVTVGIGALAIAGFLGFGSRFRSSSEPSSKPTATNILTGKNAPSPGLTFTNHATTNLLAGTNLPPVPADLAGDTNNVTASPTNTPLANPINGASTNNITPTQTGTNQITGEVSAQAGTTESEPWFETRLAAFADDAAGPSAATPSPLRLPDSAEAEKQLVRDFSKHTNAELNALGAKFSGIARDALPKIGEGQKHSPEEIKTAEAVAAEAAKGEGIDLKALVSAIRERDAAERYQKLSNQELDATLQKYNVVFEILSKTYPNDPAKVVKEVAAAADRQGDNIAALVAECTARNKKAEDAAQGAPNAQRAPVGANPGQTNSIPQTAVGPANQGAAAGRLPSDRISAQDFTMTDLNLTPLAERPAPPAAVGSPRAMANHPEMFSSANDNRFNHRGELAQLKQVIDSYMDEAKATPGINPNDSEVVWNTAVALAAAKNVNLPAASQALNLAQVQRSPAKAVRLADPKVPPTEGLVLNDAGRRGLLGLRRTTVVQSSDGAPLVVRKEGFFGKRTYSTPGISREEAEKLLTHASGGSTKTSS